MKKLFLLGVILFLAVSMNAQGNMQFNQVKHLVYSGTVTTGLSSGSLQSIVSLTVPAGKIWKVESGSIYVLSGNSNNPTNATDVYTDELILTIDKQILWKGAKYSSVGYSPAIIPNSPIWLPAGSYALSYFCPNTYSYLISYNATISAIEFNIIQ